jgi:serine/threonine protein kinase
VPNKKKAAPILSLSLSSSSSSSFRGNFAVVHLGIKRNGGDRVAIKIIDKKKVFESFRPGQLEEEVRIMKDVRHPNILRVLDVYDSEEKFYIVLEL